MKIAVLSNVRTPTRADTVYGLGNSMWALADGLARRGHAVTLFAGEGSRFPRGELVVDVQEAGRIRDGGFGAYLDGSHSHALSREHPDWPVVNRIGDRECNYPAPNAVVESAWMKSKYDKARLVKKGVDVETIPFTPEPRIGYLAYFGLLHPHKGYKRAQQVADMVQQQLRLAGQWGGDEEIEGHAGILTGDVRWEFLGQAQALLHPSIHDAAPRAILEAAACGTPALVLDGDGAMDHVEHCVSGYVVGDLVEMAEAVYDVCFLDRKKVREWVVERHGLEQWVAAVEGLLQAAADGERW